MARLLIYGYVVNKADNKIVEYVSLQAVYEYTLTVFVRFAST